MDPSADIRHNAFFDFDECFTAGPIATINSAFKTIRDVVGGFGLVLDDLKEKTSTSELDLLRARLRISQGPIDASSPLSKIHKVCV